MTDLPRPRRVRADAVRNREQILRAAVEMLVEIGPSVALETIARRAGVSIATLYRHFPDRKALLRQVSIDVLRQSADAANTALAQEPDAFSALVAYLHTAIELRIGMIMPVLSRHDAGDDELFAARDESKQALEALVKAAHGEGSLRQDVGPGDINLLVVRMARPLPLPITPDANHRLSHRHAELILDGLLRFVAGDPLPGRPLEVTELDPVPESGDEPLWVDPGGYWQGNGTGVSSAHSAADTEDRSTTNGS